jgi:phosphoglycolate phosphatase
MSCRFPLIVFDLDGTLIDSRRDLAESANVVLEQRGLPTLPEEAVGQMVGDGAAGLVLRVFSAAGVAPPSNALEQFLAEYNGRLLLHTREYPGIRDALAALHARSTLAVLTNKPIDATHSILSGLDLARFFSRVLGGDGPHPRKPDPQGLLELVARAGVEKERTVLVGDSVVDWSTARAAGTSVCLARYGFGFVGIPVERPSQTELVVDQPSDLPRVL